MKLLIVLSLAIAAALALPVDDTKIDPFIVGGVNALPGEFPFTVSIQWIVLGLSTHVCGGVIINNVWVLTAAHCVTETPTLGRLIILVGRHNLGVNEPTGVQHEIDRQRSIIHPDWREGPQVGPDDLALLRMVAPITYTDRIRNARLPVAHAIPVGPAVLSGWGSTGGQTLPNILQKTTKPVITLDSCRQAIFGLNLNGDLVDDTNLCTGPLTGGVSACSGDSGGPLVQGASPNEVVVGIVSWGITPYAPETPMWRTKINFSSLFRCGAAGAPSGVYKRVSAYTNWIFANTGIQ